MTPHLRALAASACLAVVALAAGFAAAPPARAAEPKSPGSSVEMPRYVFLHVGVDADGKVQTATSMDPNAVPALVAAATEIAHKLQFAPARKNGRPVASETSLTVVLALVPHEGGGFGIALKGARNGPSVLAIGKYQQPKVNRAENGGTVIAGADLRADGTVDMETFKIEKVDMRVPATFAQEQFEKAARFAMKDARFQLEKVDGVEIPAHVSVPFSFNGGAKKHKPGDEGDDDEGGYAKAGKDKDKAAHEPPPSLTAVSKIEGIDLPKIDYTAPEK
jgi:hypothetical protein